MAQYQHILLAVELDSQFDQHLIHKTRALMQQYSAKVSVVHAIESVANFGAAYGVSVGIDVEDVLSDQALEMLQAIGQQLGVAETQQYLVHGTAKQTILERADKLGVDLIVIGSHGRHGMRLLLGSTANAVLHRAKCDVLAIKIQS